MKKSLLLSVVAALTFGAANAQVTNRAIEFESNGTVDCGQLPTLGGLASYTVQLWLNPTVWTPGATLLSRGDDFTVKLGNENEIVFTVGNASLTASSADLTAGTWNSVMLICNSRQGEAFVNGASAGKGTLAIVPDSDASLTLGGGFAGLLDEVRLWNTVLDSEYDYFLNNTLNKWAPQWDNLLVYYKMDQADTCPNLIDYKVIEKPDAKWNNHGIFSEGVKRVDANNPKMPYLWNAAYTENVRFYDRIIPRDQYLLSNAVIILGADAIPETGGIKTRTPNYHAQSFESAPILSDYQGREGVVSFDGNGKIVCNMATFTKDGTPSLSTYTFETWIYLEEWTPGAYIFQKENSAQNEGIAVYLGSDDEKRIFFRINGNVYCSNPEILPVGEWAHFAFTPGSSSVLSNSLYVFVNGKKPLESLDIYTSGTSKVIDNAPIVNNSQNTYIGQGLKAKLDETCIWQKTFTGGDIKDQMTYIPLPALNRNVRADDMNNVNTYYRYDNPDWPGFSSHSQDNWMFIMKGAYEGHGGAKMYLSVNGKYGEPPAWLTICNTPAKRQVFAKALAELSELYDGMELDMEWVSDWTNYSIMVDSILKYLPADKEFRISTHNSYYKYPKAKINEEGITGFTFQQYGPQAAHFGYQNFVNNLAAFETYGYPKDKIVSSYSTTTSKNSSGTDPTGIRTLMPTYKPNPNANSEVQDGFTFMGPYQVYKRAKYTREQDLQGIFYWDMGNDYWEGTVAAPIMPKYNYAKYCSYGINANVDSVITTVNVLHYGESGIEDITASKPENKKMVITPSPVIDRAEVTVGGLPVDHLSVYSLSGAAVIAQKNDNIIDAAGLASGVYMVSATTGSGENYRGKFTKR